MNRKIIAASVSIAILFVGAIAGTMLYYNGLVTSLKNDIANLKIQVANLGGFSIASSYLVTNLGVTKIDAQVGLGGIPPYNHLWIDGKVTNKGGGVAYHAGLAVVAYAANGTVVINMTVPLNPLNEDPQTNPQWYGANAEINAYLVTRNHSPLQFESLDRGATVDVSIHIFHEGIASNWTITPLCTGSP